MFGIGSSELLVIMAVALLVLGPKNLPKIARSLGKAMGEFRRYSTEFQRTLNTEIALEEQGEKKKQQEAQARAANAVTTATPGPAEKKPGSLEIPVPDPQKAGPAPAETVAVASAEIVSDQTAAKE